MLHKLTPEQAAKLRREWVWCFGQKSDRSRLRVVAIGDVPDDNDGYIYFSRDDDGYEPGELMPDLSDDVTRDGLLRTARRAWKDEHLHLKLMVAGARSWWQVRKGNGYPLNDSNGFLEGATEEEALLAAILAAPERS